MSSILLSLLIWVPVIGALLTILIDRQNRQPELAKWVALGFALLTLVLCIPMLQAFDADSYQMQLTESVAWIPQWGINYSLGVDGISVLFIVLSAFTNLVVILSAWNVIKDRVGQYMAIFLLSTGIVNGAFAATNAILFYIFFEASMVPMFLSVGIWGSKRRAYASMKFFLYTFLGSIFMLVAFLYLYTRSGSFDITILQTLANGIHPVLTRGQQDWIFLAFLAAFAVKIPMWPVHTWLPDAHTEAPSGGSVVLAALMLKMGAYGFIRFSLPIVPDVHASLDWLLIALSLIAIVYVGFASIVQKDMKRLIAYSSVSHMGLVTLGIFMVFMIVGQSAGHDAAAHADATLAVQGAIFQMIAHAFSSGALFIGVGYLYDRFGSRLVKDYQGVAHVMPVFAAFYMLFAMANVGLPGTSGFVGEFMVILAAFKAHIWIAIVASLTLVLAPAYTLWMYKRVIFGELKDTRLEKGQDLTKNEWLVFGLLAIPVIVFGVYPEAILHLSHASAEHFVAHATADIVPGTYR